MSFNFNMKSILKMVDVLPIPTALIHLVFEFNPEHREKYRIVMDELINEISVVDDNDACNECGEYLGYDYIPSKFERFPDINFCDRRCEWSFEYDYRKACRQNMNT
jgi:hypothetical protein